MNQYPNNGLEQIGLRIYCRTCSCFVTSFVKKSQLNDHLKSKLHTMEISKLNSNSSTDRFDTINSNESANSITERSNSTAERTNSTTASSNSTTASSNSTTASSNSTDESSMDDSISTEHSFNSFVSADEINKATLKMFAQLNIPFEKLNHPSFLEYKVKYIRNGRKIVKTNQARTKIADYHLEEQVKLKDLLKDRNLSIIIDATQDAKGNHVLNLIVETDLRNGRNSYFLDSVSYRQTPDSRDIFVFVLKVLNSYSIQFDSVIAFVTDNAAYNFKAFKHLSEFLINAIHVTCWSHIYNLVCESFRNEFEDLNEMIKGD